MIWDSWLQEYYKDELDAVDERCRAGATIFEAFNAISDPYLWNILLWKEYKGYDAIKAALPGAPDVSTQTAWAGRSGMVLGDSVIETYRVMHDKLRLHLNKPLREACVLDYGCGWGNVIRYFMKDVPLDRLHGCDPHQGIIQVAKRLNPAADIQLSQSLPKTLPFEVKFDFIYALSIWTHLSPLASEVCLNAIHASLSQDGLVYLTVRPPAYAHYAHIAKLPGWDPTQISETIGKDGIYFYPQSYPVDGVPTFGETIVTKDYIQKNWGDRFKLIDVGINGISPYQGIIVLRKI